MFNGWETCYKVAMPNEKCRLGVRWIELPPDQRCTWTTQQDLHLANEGLCACHSTKWPRVHYRMFPHWKLICKLAEDSVYNHHAYSLHSDASIRKVVFASVASNIVDVALSLLQWIR